MEVSTSSRVGGPCYDTRFGLCDLTRLSVTLQGSVLSPPRCGSLMNASNEAIDAATPGFRLWNGRDAGGPNIRGLAFADDQALLSDRIEGARKGCRLVDACARIHGHSLGVNALNKSTYAAVAHTAGEGECYCPGVIPLAVDGGRSPLTQMGPHDTYAHLGRRWEPAGGDAVEVAHVLKLIDASMARVGGAAVGAHEWLAYAEGLVDGVVGCHGALCAALSDFDRASLAATASLRSAAGATCSSRFGSRAPRGASQRQRARRSRPSRLAARAPLRRCRVASGARTPPCTASSTGERSRQRGCSNAGGCGRAGVASYGDVRAQTYLSNDGSMILGRGAPAGQPRGRARRLRHAWPAGAAGRSNDCIVTAYSV